MPRLTSKRQEARQGVILAAAREVFVERGLHVATTHDVARAAGVPVGSIYTYFASKDELIRASILAANKDETEAVLRNMQTAGTFRERLMRALAGWYAYTIEAPGVAAFLADVWAEAARRPLIRDLVARRRERVVMVATILLREGLTAGELRARPGRRAGGSPVREPARRDRPGMPRGQRQDPVERRRAAGERALSPCRDRTSLTTTVVGTLARPPQLHSPHGPTPRVRAARRVRCGGVPGRARADGDGGGAAVHPGQPRWRDERDGLGRAAQGELDHQRLPAGLHPGHAAVGPPGRPVGGATPVHRRAGPLRPRVRAGRCRPGPRPVDRRPSRPGARRRRPGAGRHGRRVPPVRRRGAASGARGHRCPDLPGHGGRARAGRRHPWLGPCRERARGDRCRSDRSAEPRSWRRPGAGSSISTCRSGWWPWSWPGPPRPAGRRPITAVASTCSVPRGSGSPWSLASSD